MARSRQIMCREKAEMKLLPDTGVYGTKQWMLFLLSLGSLMQPTKGYPAACEVAYSLSAHKSSTVI